MPRGGEVLTQARGFHPPYTFRKPSFRVKNTKLRRSRILSIAVLLALGLSAGARSESHVSEDVVPSVEDCGEACSEQGILEAQAEFITALNALDLQNVEIDRCQVSYSWRPAEPNEVADGFFFLGYERAFNVAMMLPSEGFHKLYYTSDDGSRLYILHTRLAEDPELRELTIEFSRWVYDRFGDIDWPLRNIVENRDIIDELNSELARRITDFGFVDQRVLQTNYGDVIRVNTDLSIFDFDTEEQVDDFRDALEQFAAGAGCWEVEL